MIITKATEVCQTVFACCCACRRNIQTRRKRAAENPVPKPVVQGATRHISPLATALNEKGELAVIEGSKSSIMKEFFGLRQETEGDDDSTCVICLLCETLKDATLSYQGSTTSHLEKHLELRHPVQFQEFIARTEGPVDSRQITIDARLKRARLEEQRHIKQGLCNMRTKARVTCESNMCALAATLRPEYEPPTPQRMAKLLSAEYEAYIGELKKVAENVDLFSLTTDGRAGNRFIALTVHWTTQEWRIENKCIALSAITGMDVF